MAAPIVWAGRIPILQQAQIVGCLRPSARLNERNSDSGDQNDNSNGEGCLKPVPIEEKLLWELVGNRVSEARERANLSRAEVIQASGLTNTAYYNLEGGRGNFMLSTLVRVLNVIGCGIEEIFRADNSVQFEGRPADPDAIARLQERSAQAVLQVAAVSTALAELRVTTDGLHGLAGKLRPTSENSLLRGKNKKER